MMKRVFLPINSPKLLTLLSPEPNFLYHSTKVVAGALQPSSHSCHRKNLCPSIKDLPRSIFNKPRFV